jgi:hypothetical protein
MDILIIIIASLTISFWAYSNVWSQKGLLRYAHGYLIFVMVQWILILINMVWIWGWLIGLVVFAALMLGGAIFITNHTTNQIYRLLKISPDVGLALFCIFVWILGISTTIKIFI